MSIRSNYRTLFKFGLVLIVCLLIVDATMPPHQQVSVHFALAGIWVYQHSFGLLLRNSKICKFHPSCSNYSKLALEKYGIVKGSSMTGIRLLRCSPFSDKKGEDYP